MKILHCVELYFPSIGGMQEVVRQLSERLVSAGHEVTVATRKLNERKESTHNGVAIIEFDIQGNYAYGMKGEVEAYRKFLLSSRYDIVTFFAAQQWATDIALPILDQIRGKKISVPTGYSGFYMPEFQTYFSQMKSWIFGYDMNIYLSHDYTDIRFAQENGVTHLTVIPNGAGENEFLLSSTLDIRKELNIPKNHFILLHVGTYTGAKGHQEAIEIFLRSSIPHATLLMIGDKAEKYEERYIKKPLMFFLRLINKLKGDKRIIFDSFSREHTVAAYQQSDLFLFPSNIECSPIVLFECAAAGLPFISTEVGNAAEIAQWTHGGEIMPTRKDANRFSHPILSGSVKLLNSLYNNKEKRKEMSDTSRKIWKEKFSWEVIAKQYEELYLEISKKE